jgi:uncharacterized protein (TIGR03437 family)
MARTIQSGSFFFHAATRKQLCARLVLFSAAFALLSFDAQAQGNLPVCLTGNDAASVRPEGLTEPLGDLVLLCSGGVAGSLVSTNLFFVTLNTNITNRTDANGNPLGITVTVDTGSGPVNAATSVSLYSMSTLTVNGFQYTIPTPSTTGVTIRIHGLLAAVASIPLSSSAPILVTAALTATGLQVGGMQPLNLGYAVNPGLLDSVINNGIPCDGPLLPASPITFNGLVAAGILSSSIRLSEGNATSFAPKAAGDDTGVRFILNISGYGTSLVYIPDAIVGNDGTTPTSAGAFGFGASGGQFTPGANQLLLTRVTGAEANGVGGSLLIGVPGSVTNFLSVNPLVLTDGAAYAVYEVLSANPQTLETAQIPVFLSPQTNSCATAGVPTLGVNIAPVSTVAVGTQTDTLPRFVYTVPESDCTLNGDCSASYFPSFSVNRAPLNISGSSFGLKQTATLLVTDTSTYALLSFTASVTYQSGSKWLTVSPGYGVGTTTLILTADPSALAEGVYNASVTINAGTAGMVSVPVVFNVGATTAIVQAVVNAASYVEPVVPDSFIAIFGRNFSGKNVTVTFNGQPAQIVYNGDTQINVLAPALPTGQNSTANVIVSVGGFASNTFIADTSAYAPGVFNPGILNQDNTINSQAQPAALGSEIQVFLTGLTLPVTVPVTVEIGNQSGLPTLYAGGVATIPGLDQVNVIVPASITPSVNGVALRVCVPAVLGGTYCSSPVNLYVQ